MVSTTDEIVTEAASVDAQVPAEIKSISEEEFEKAQKTFQLGKKNLFLNKYDEAVTNIGDACTIYSSKFGEFDPQCAEIYFFYGRSLLELARVESTVLGNALNGVPEDSSPIDDSRYGNPEDVNAEEKQEISDKVIDALCGNEEEMKSEESDKKEDETKTEEKTEAEKPTEQAETEMKEAEVVTEKKEEATEEEAEEDEAEDEEESAEDGEDITKAEGEAEAEAEAEADDISNLQRSWEMFELAKLVYTKHFNDDLTMKNKRIAECLLKLGEISIEQETYEQANTDITESIKLQEEQTGEQRDERMLAESYYQLGLAQQFNNQFTEANESYQKSVNIVQLRVEKLKGKLAQLGEGADAELEKTSINDEITELEALLPEMSAKQEEVTEQGQQSVNLIKECFLSNIEAKQQVNGDAEVKDITSLVKSKRKISTSDETTVGIKKTRLSGTNDEIAQTVNQEESKIEVDVQQQQVAEKETPKEMETETETNKENVPVPVVEQQTNTLTEQVEKIAVDEVVPEASNAVDEQQAPIATA